MEFTLFGVSSGKYLPPSMIGPCKGQQTPIVSSSGLSQMLRVGTLTIHL
jgi:hypothetical protein